MPFIGKDWRAPGETWVRVEHTAGWELIKLRPIQLSACHAAPQQPADAAEAAGKRLHRSSTCSAASVCSWSLEQLSNGDVSEESDADGLLLLSSSDGAGAGPAPLSHSSSTTSAATTAHYGGSGRTAAVRSSDSDGDDAQADGDVEEPEEEKWIPHCFVKSSRSKEFIGCTSMSEAFHRLDLARAVTDVRRFNYVCKVVQILVHEKLHNISATARKHLFAIIQAMVIHSVDQDVHVSTARELLNGFSCGLEEGHVCGSPHVVSRQLDAVSSLMDLVVQDRKPTTLADSTEQSTTFLDLPRELISLILRRLPDHVSLLETAKAHETLEALIEKETRVWQTLCQFHFTHDHIDKHRRADLGWRHTFFELKKYYGLREVYADLIHICCHCKALFWKDHGHPCVGKEAPSVRVTPQQFVDMLLFL